jgi:tripartite ATP-independent transporter DctM subunit
MLVSGAIGVYLLNGWEPLVGILTSGPYEHVASFTLSAVPMFVLLGEFLSAGKFTKDLFDSTNRWLGHFRGGLAYAAVCGGALLAAISGSTAAAAATLASAAYPSMKRYGYADSFSTGVLAVVGTLAIMIPPSLAFVLYGVFTETSVAKMLIAGVIPGVLTALGYGIAIFVTVRRNPELAPSAGAPAPMIDRFRSLLGIWPILLLMISMLVGIYSGAVTPTEVGAVGALMALLIGLVMRRIKRGDFFHALKAGSRSSAMVLAIIAGSAVFSVFLTLTGVTQDLVAFIQSSGFPRYGVLLAVLMLLLILGFFLDQLAILVLVLPLAFPLMTSLNFDPIWFGVIFVKTAEIGFITPPMGLNAFVVSGATGVPTTQVFKGIWPFVLIEFVLLALLIAVPELATWLPNNM